MESEDTRLELKLRRAETEISDDGFTETLMGSLPAKRRGRASVRRWTLGGAAAAGSFVTSILGAPIESAFSSFVLGGDERTMVIAIATITLLAAIPTAWVFYRK